MDAELLAKLERVAALDISLLAAPEVTSHFLFTRDGAVVLVERRGEGFGAVGSPGMLSDRGGGFAALVERGGRTLFISKGEEREALPGEAERARRLFTDLKTALR